MTHIIIFVDQVRTPRRVKTKLHDKETHKQHSREVSIAP